MKLLIAHADGLLAEATDEMPNVDPIPSGVNLLRTLMEATGYPLILTFDGANPTHTDAWLHLQHIRPMRLVPTGHLEANKRLEEVLSLVGTLQGTVGLYVGTQAYDCRFMSGHGYTALQYHEPMPDRSGWGLDKGATWGSLVAPEDAE